MTMPFYASAEQIMRDRSEYARKGIARGRSVVVLTYVDGVLFVAENPHSLHKVGEIYDRIGFAAAGKYNEFENLRVAGVRLADLRGYSYDRRDVTGRFLANAYAQTLGALFTEQQKPYEVEICVAEVGASPGDDQMYRLTYDGSIVDEPEFVVMGGTTEPLVARLRESYQPQMPLGQAVRVAVRALASVGGENGKPRELPASQLEVAVLDRTRPTRKFKRVTGRALEALLAEGPAQPEPAATGPANAGPANAGPANAGPANAGPANAGPANAGPAGPASSETPADQTPSGKAGPARPGSTAPDPTDEG